MSAEQPTAAPVPEALAFREVPWRLRHVVIGLVLLAFAILIFSPLARHLPPAAAVFVIVAIETWVLAYPFAVARRYGWRPRLAVSPTRVAFELLLSFMVVVALWAVIALGYFAWSAAFGEPPPRTNPLDRAARSANPLVGLLALLTVVVLGPVAEEVFFRGMVYRALRRRTFVPFAIIVQAVAFGILHAGYGAAHVVATTVAGVALALVYDARKALVAPILCHMMHNAAVFAVAVLTAAWAWDLPALGVHGEPHESGMLVTSVTPGGGAEAAGIRAGDVLYTVNGWGVQNAEHVGAALGDRQPGESVPVEYLRDGALHRVDVVLKSRRELKREADPARDRP